MKNKILATLVAFGIAGNVSAIEINENLSINGFIDGSYQHNDNDGLTSVGADPSTTDQSLGLDEVEINFLINVGGVSGVINLDSEGAGGTGEDEGVQVEQAHVTYSLDNGVSFTLGKYGSALGFEGEDPTGLYTFSRAYSSDSGFNFKNIDNRNLHVVEGLTVAYASDAFGIAASFENGLDIDGEEDELNLELSFSYTGIENVTIAGGYFFDNQGNNADESDALNINVSTTMGKLMLAAEYTEIDRGSNVGDGSDLDGWMVLADYDFNDKLGAAFRVSSNELNAADDYEKVTIAPNYAITESLGAILEYSDVENAGADGNELALEFLYTF